MLSGFSLVVAGGVYSLVGVCGHLVVVASVSEHRLSMHSVVAASGL